MPPLTGQQQLPAELPWMLPVPAVNAPAGLADQTATGAITQAMPAVPSLGHAPLLTDLARHRIRRTGCRTIARQDGILTRDLGGTASTKDVTRALIDALDS